MFCTPERGSVGIRFARLGDTDLVVCKGQQPTRGIHLYLWHMATDALGRRLGTMFGRLGRPGNSVRVRLMTSQADLVVDRSFSNHVFVWIVTCDTAEAPIRPIKAFTVFEAIGLESHI